MKPIQHRSSYLLIFSSLALLALLITLWIGKLFNDEIETIKVGSRAYLQNITSDLRFKMYDNRLKALPLDDLVYIPTLGYINKDSATYLRENNLIESLVDSIQKVDAQYFNFTKKIRKEAQKRKETIIISGLLHPIYNERSMVNSLGSINSLDSLVTEAITPQFDSVINRTYGAKIIFHKMKNENDTLSHSGLNLGQIVCLFRSQGIFGYQYYGYQMPDYRKVVLKKFIPQLLFSFLVFICTGIAFVLMVISMGKLRQLSIIKNEFMSNMTHELKTPISTVAAALEALTNFNVINDKSRTEEYIDISKKEINRLSMLVDKVLKMTLFDIKKPELALERLNLKQLITEITSSMKLLFDKVGGKYELSFEGDGFLIMGDNTHITNVIYNLIENALKYTEKTPVISISVVAKKNSLIMAIADNGPGILVEHQGKVFDKFFRVPNDDRHNIKGYGLGLSYVQKIIQMHNGSISLKSNTKKGATFLVTLSRYDG